jgi:hypothetical protein
MLSVLVSLGITTGRAASLAALAIALISLVTGGLALRRSGRARALWALVGGMISVVSSGLHLASSTGAIGTGSGRLGAIVALAVGLIGTGLGGLALARARRVV